jgi:hypothetical protein
MKRRDFLMMSAAVAGLGACGQTSVADAPVEAAPEVAAAPPVDPDALTVEELEETALLEIEELAALGITEIETVLAEGTKFSTKSVLTPNSMSTAFPVPPLTDELRAAFAARKYWDVPTPDRPVPVWPALNKAPDYIHLAGYALAAPEFTLSSDLLARLAERNAFAINAAGPVVVFGLRGCRMVTGGEEAGWASEHAVVVETPTHLAPKCLVGLWRPADGQIALFRSSTVPAAHNMYASLAEQGNGTSLLPTGLYQYMRGDHKASKPKSIQRGALRMNDSYAVLRTAAELTYDPFLPTTAWTRGAAHNIHAAGLSDIFDSAGCQVVHGTYIKPERLKTKGAWDAFRRFAGTVDETGAAPPATAQKNYQYMLLTGLEAALAYHGGADFEAGYSPLRFGSSGQKVADLQAQLITNHGSAVKGLPANGTFDMLTSFGVLLENKFLVNEYTTPVFVAQPV